jgi:hypothetical protein
MIGGREDSRDELGLWRDPLDHIVYCERPEDPKEYGFICPGCFVRYGEPSKYVEVERCDKCPPYYPGMEIGWTIGKRKRDELKSLGYFSAPQRGGKKKKTTSAKEA